MAIAEFVVDVSRGFGGQAADACFDHLVKRVDCRCCDKFLCLHASHDFSPVAVLSFLFELQSYGVDNPV